MSNSDDRPIPPLRWYTSAFEQLQNEHPLPQPQSVREKTAFRFEKENIEAALLLKLARYISSLHAGQLLLAQGFLQELSTLQRTLDEIHEDILFLGMPFFGFSKTEDHQRYLQNFWANEPEFREFSGHQRNRWSIPRKTVRRYLSQVNPERATDHSAIAVSAYLSRLYSGYLHAAAPQLLELYDPKRRSFRLTGYPESSLLKDHRHDFDNQFFRGVLCVSFVARILSADQLAAEA
ncbi:hypothetical protein [uncultured Roseobacter sp.]|nr:hypothetical protein [uncultured Roseobacter sp.]